MRVVVCKNQQNILKEPFVKTKLGEVCNFKQGNQFGLEEQLNYPHEGYVRFLRIENYTQNSMDFRFVKVDDENKIIDEKDIVIVRYGASAGYVGRGFSGVLANNLFRVIPKERLDREFLYYLLTDERVYDYFQKSMIGGAMPALSFKIVENLKVQLPSLPEQQKIASILSTWDKAIELKEKLIEQKKQQKKGLMQKLLTGEVRLPGFDGEWEQVRLGELAKLQGGYAFKSSMFKEKGIPIVRISNILPEITDYNQEFVYYDEIKISDNFMVQYGDILIAMSGATTGKVGIYKKNEIAYLNQRVGKFVNLDKSKLDYGYLYYLVTSTKFKTQLTEELATGAQPNISSKQIENFKFKIPSINEQISISKILAQFDKFISLQEKELIYLKQQKKGLMQLLLTGKVRVKV
ncbi:restriction endonuclease subunit S [Heyndrickxia faecalis]|uniref:Restriction endonuclease subunit S n=1 Tax=Heyndrickxia faecalis TaxID=2824910 RepID=A0AAU7WHU2_9BACI